MWGSNSESIDSGVEVIMMGSVIYASERRKSFVFLRQTLIF
jgi:hypothetical protein